MKTGAFWLLMLVAGVSCSRRTDPPVVAVLKTEHERMFDALGRSLGDSAEGIGDRAIGFG